MFMECLWSPEGVRCGCERRVFVVDVVVLAVGL